MTNAMFAKTNDIFIKACEIAKIPASQRQASKYRSKRGLAWQNRTEAKIKLWKEASK